MIEKQIRAVYRDHADHAESPLSPTVGDYDRAGTVHPPLWKWTWIYI